MLLAINWENKQIFLPEILIFSRKYTFLHETPVTLLFIDIYYVTFGSK